MIVSPEECGRELLDVVPIIMRDIRSEMRSRRSPDLTVPQFRALAFINRNEGSSLSELANHIGLTLPSVSRLVDGLISRGFIAREEHPTDRRRLKLALTNNGQEILETSRHGTLTYLAKKLSDMHGGDREIVSKAMEALRSVFRPASK